jgi:hypothetical protein
MSREAAVTVTMAGQRGSAAPVARLRICHRNPEVVSRPHIALAFDEDDHVVSIDLDGYCSLPVESQNRIQISG